MDGIEELVGETLSTVVVRENKFDFSKKLLRKKIQQSFFKSIGAQDSEYLIEFKVNAFQSLAMERVSRTTPQKIFSTHQLKVTILRKKNTEYHPIHSADPLCSEYCNQFRRKSIQPLIIEKKISIINAIRKKLNSN